jgi:hypothetical protein
MNKMFVAHHASSCDGGALRRISSVPFEVSVLQQILFGHHGENRPYLATPDREIGSCTQSPQMCWHVPLTTSGVRHKLSYLRDTVNDGTLIIQ